MLIANFTTEKSNMASSRTAEDFSMFLGVRPERLGLVSRLYPNLTSSFLTESLMNVFYNDTKGSKYKSLNAMLFEFDIDVAFIDRIEFAAEPVAIAGHEYEVKFVKRYYEKYDTFIIDGSRQQMIVLSEPQKTSDGAWSVVADLIDADYGNTLDLAFCRPGCKTRFMSNYHPEYHEEGLIKTVILIRLQCSPIVA